MAEPNVDMGGRRELPAGNAQRPVNAEICRRRGPNSRREAHQW